ncbi:MAG TPA: hypothetical protein DDY86_06740 [Syntrophaceae bacterium]|nr:hypothetical protein [Syntrophaceae bacterium]
MTEKLQIIAQVSGYKNLKIEGGFRLQLDIFESRDQDVAMCALLANKRQTLKLTIEPVEEKK